MSHKQSIFNVIIFSNLIHLPLLKNRSKYPIMHLSNSPLITFIHIRQLTCSNPNSPRNQPNELISDSFLFKKTRKERVKNTQKIQNEAKSRNASGITSSMLAAKKLIRLKSINFSKCLCVELHQILSNPFKKVKQTFFSHPLIATELCPLGTGVR